MLLPHPSLTKGAVFLVRHLVITLPMSLSLFFRGGRVKANKSKFTLSGNVSLQHQQACHRHVWPFLMDGRGKHTDTPGVKRAKLVSAEYNALQRNRAQFAGGQHPEAQESCSSAAQGNALQRVHQVCVCLEGSHEWEVRPC